MKGKIDVIMCTAIRKILHLLCVLFCNKFGDFFRLKIMAYYRAIFCNEFSDSFSLKILAYYSVMFCNTIFLQYA